MSIKYRDNNGQETIISGLTPGGDIEAGAVMTRSGKVDVSPLEVGAYQVVNVTFDTPMPDDTYIINIDCTSGRLNIATFNKTVNGFSIVYLNSSNLVQPQGDSIDWTATKTYTIQHAQQNAEDIATLKQATPAGAGPSNKFATANDITRVEAKVEDIADAIDPNASITNKLVAQSTLTSALGGKQDALEFDNTPTAGSNNPVTSNGIKTAIQQISQVIPTDASSSNKLVTASGMNSALENIQKLRFITKNSTTSSAELTFKLEESYSRCTGLILVTQNGASQNSVYVFSVNNSGYFTRTKLIGQDVTMTKADTSNEIKVSVGNWSSVSILTNVAVR